MNEHQIRTFLVERYDRLLHMRHNHEDALYWTFVELREKLDGEKHAGVGRGGFK